jgi:hypothetical protein
MDAAPVAAMAQSSGTSPLLRYAALTRAFAFGAPSGARGGIEKDA